MHHQGNKKKSTCSEWLKPPRTLFKKCCSDDPTAAIRIVSPSTTEVAASPQQTPPQQQSIPSIDQPLLTQQPAQQSNTNSLTVENTMSFNADGHLKTNASDFSTMSSVVEKTLRNDVTVMIVGLVVVFLICQLPSSVLRLLMFQNIRIQFEPAYVHSLDVSNFLIVVNSTLNCILCVMLGRKFRREFIQCFFGRFVKPRRSETSTYYLNTLHTAY